MAKEKTVYVCSNCGQDSPKWVGKCPSCGEWNTYVEEIVRKEPVNRRPVSGIETQKPKPVILSEIIADDEPRINMHDNELNRVLGGGLVPGSLVLIGGEPGIGKSTLVMQTVLRMPEKKILYVSGEESARQLKLRADRLSEVSSDCFIVCETSLEQIYVHIKKYESGFGYYRLHTDYLYGNHRIVSRKYRSGQRVFGIYPTFRKGDSYAGLAYRTYK